MRYDKQIYFQKIKQSAYNKDTGNYDESDPEEEMCWASVMDTGAEMINLVYGDIRQKSLTISLQNYYEKPFDQIRIGDTIYKVDLERKLRIKHIFIVSEIQ